LSGWVVLRWDGVCARDVMPEESLVEGKLFVVADENKRAKVACDCRVAGG
jgi:predicted RNA-binding protein